MKRLKLYLAGIAVVSMLFTSCSKDDGASINQPEQELATLSFEPVLNDLLTNRSQTKQEIGEFPECSSDDPAYVGIILSSNGSNVVGETGDPFKVDLTSGQLFTQEVPELKLAPGVYSLDYFGVYNEDDELIWLAPAGGLMAGLVDSPLPLSINLGAGVKKYVDVSVVCFDDRMVNEYGYLFFELDGVQAIEFCIFGNYCDESGRHYPAEFSVSVWDYEDGQQGSQLYSNLQNEVTLDENGDYSGSIVCIALPDTDGLDEYYFEISILSSDAYGAVQEQVIRSGVITDEDVRDLFDGESNLEYYHFREGNCNLGDSPDLFEEGSGNGGGNGGGNGECDPNDPNADCDKDEVINSVDQCPDTDPGVAVDEVGCESIQVPGRDIVVFNDINIFDNINNAMDDPNNVRLVQNLVSFTTSGKRNNGSTVWFDRGRNSQCYNDDFCNNLNLSEMRTVILNEGLTIEDIFSSSGSITEIPDDVKTIFLWLPVVAYTVNEINTFKLFASEGGRIIFVGEWDNYYNQGGPGIATENQFLENMGAVLANTGGALDCGLGSTLPSSSLREHPIMEGIESLTIACASVIEPGPDDFPLFYDTTGTYVLGGVAKIDTAPIDELKIAGSKMRITGPKEEMVNPASPTGI